MVAKIILTVHGEWGDMTISKDFHYFAYQMPGRTVGVVNLRTGEKIAEIKCNGLVNNLLFIPSTHILITVTDTGYLEVWNVEPVFRRKEIKLKGGSWPDSVALNASPNGKWFFVYRSEKYELEIETTNFSITAERGPNPPGYEDFHPDQTDWYIQRSDDGVLFYESDFNGSEGYIHNLHSGDCVALTDLHDPDRLYSSYPSCAFSSDNNYFVGIVESEDGDEIRLYDTKSGSLLIRHQYPREMRIGSFTFVPRSKASLAIMVPNGDLYIINGMTNKILRTFPNPDPAPNMKRILFSDDGRYIAMTREENLADTKYSEDRIVLESLLEIWVVRGERRCFRFNPSGQEGQSMFSNPRYNEFAIEFHDGGTRSFQKTLYVIDLGCEDERYDSMMEDDNSRIRNLEIAK